MSAEAAPITASAFALAIADLPLSTLHLKAAELRNSLAHLQYSNTQLEPYARPPTGSSEAPDKDCEEAIEENIVVMERYRERLDLLKQEAQKRGVDWDELEKMFEGEGVRAGTAEESDMSPQERESLRSLAATVPSAEGLEGLAVTAGVDGGRTEGQGGEDRMMVDGQRVGTHSAWSDGTFQMGRINAQGEIVMDVDPTAPPSRSAASASAAPQTNGVNGVGNEEEDIQGVTAPRTNGETSRQGGRLSDEELRRRTAEQLEDQEEEGVYL